LEQVNHGLAGDFSGDPASDLMPFDEITSVFAGNFVYKALVTATTWKDDMKGALSFTFDDGYKGAFEFGAAELEAEGLKGTFYYRYPDHH
jgi:peptidoglycan/xylan/chitin deacetylase (PgdA/CDA1 family)